MKKSPALKNQRGQGTVEALLLMAIIVSGTMIFSNMMQQQQFLQKLVGKPWSTLSGMIECGVWSGCGAGKHPNSLNRSISYRPDQ